MALSFDVDNPSRFVVFDPFCRFVVCVLSFLFPSCRLALFLFLSFLISLASFSS